MAMTSYVGLYEKVHSTDADLALQLRYMHDDCGQTYACLTSDCLMHAVTRYLQRVVACLSTSVRTRAEITLTGQKSAASYILLNCNAGVFRTRFCCLSAQSESSLRRIWEPVKSSAASTASETHRDKGHVSQTL